MDIIDFFDIHNKEHIEAYEHLIDHGMWPEWFLPDNLESPPNLWQIRLESMMAEEYRNLMRAGRSNQ